jgi:hypothetical protein
MNPFEAGIVNANGLHGIASRQIAQKKIRRVQNKSYPFFYNPMWNLLGDFTPGPPGTFYCNSAEHTEYFWYMFDQVLIRPELIDAFSYKDLQILFSDGEQSLLSQLGVPDKKVGSDHLPILFKIRL